MRAGGRLSSAMAIIIRKIYLYTIKLSVKGKYKIYNIHAGGGGGASFQDKAIKISRNKMSNFSDK